MFTLSEIKKNTEEYHIYGKDNILIGMLDGRKCLVKIFKGCDSENIVQLKEELEQSEHIAELFKINGINVINAISYNGKYIHQYGDKLFAVYSWYAGKTYYDTPVDNNVCEMIGETIGKMHALGLKSERINSRSRLQTIDFNELDYDSKNYESVGLIAVGIKKLTGFKEQIPVFSESYERIIHDERNILCQRDTGIGNFIVYKNSIYVLDWERAGYEYPEFELFDTCLEWSGFGEKTDWEKYRSIVRGYYNVVGNSYNVPYEDVFNTMIYTILHRIYVIILNVKYKKDTMEICKISSYITQLDELMKNKNLYIDNLKN